MRRLVTPCVIAPRSPTSAPIAKPILRKQRHANHTLQSRNIVLKPGKTGIRRIVDASGYSIQGLKAAWLHEAAFRQEMILTTLLSIVAFLLPVTHVERILLISSLLLVVIVELLNSAVEAVVDRIGSEHHELSGRAKDIGSAAVFVALALTLFVWSSVLLA
ncbi:diacylglycerol kinase [Vibrio navarrensis]|uniref:Diacylglycerol kinase n=1 Tax=Vibrio navarrensis TaxID=29495 RepID=A0AAJ4LW63_9VIBR|nr:diacylglycerol kinase [Vibrio navarrensis]